jgi:hypothetical protein
MQAQVFELPLPAADEAAPLTEAQHTLRRVIASKSHEEKVVADVNKRLQRLQQIVDDDAAIEAKIRELQLAHQRERGLWLEQGAATPEPKAAKELLEARHDHAQTQGDVSAAMSRLGAVAAEQREAIERLQTAGRQVDLAVYTAAVEACRPAAVLAAAAFRTGLQRLALVLSVVEELRRAPVDDTAAYSAATEIDRLVSEARGAGVPPTPEIGRQLFDALHVNPMAELPL